MQQDKTGLPQEIDWGSFEVRQEPQDLLGTMWVRPLGGGALDNYFVLFTGVSFPIPIPPGSPLIFLAVDLGRPQSPQEFYERSLKRLGAAPGDVNTYRTLEAPVPWEPDQG
jgi:hypothetical protein